MRLFTVLVIFCTVIMAEPARLQPAYPVHTPKRFTRGQIEWRMDELALQFQRTHDKKLITVIANLSRVLARMRDDRQTLPSTRSVSNLRPHSRRLNRLVAYQQMGGAAIYGLWIDALGPSSLRLTPENSMPSLQQYKDYLICTAHSHLTNGSFSLGM